jgi:hypothetical protein
VLGGSGGLPSSVAPPLGLLAPCLLRNFVWVELLVGRGMAVCLSLIGGID